MNARFEFLNYYAQPVDIRRNPSLTGKIYIACFEKAQLVNVYYITPTPM
ncbi:MAG: hypothetical protein QM790_02025 [Nibricoccus sp.]